MDNNTKFDKQIEAFILQRIEGNSSEKMVQNGTKWYKMAMMGTNGNYRELNRKLQNPTKSYQNWLNQKLY